MGKDDGGNKRGGGRPSKGPPADSRLPNRAPEAMRLVWGLGCLTSRQAALLWPGPVSERRVRQVFVDLLACGLLQRDRRAIEYAPSNARLLLLDGATEGVRRNWEDLYTLTPRGVRYVAHNLEIPHATARSRYNRSYSDGRREHAYLRSEFLALHGAGSCLRDPQSRLDRFEAEGGVGRLTIPARPGRRARVVEPDGLMEVSRHNPWAYPPDGDQRFRRIFLLEVDTGTQDRVAQIANKIFAYSSWFLANGTERFEYGDKLHPTVLFVSPTRERSLTVRRFVKRARLEWERSPFERLDALRLRQGHKQGALDLFCVTNLEVLRERGAWTEAYSYLCYRGKYAELY